MKRSIAILAAALGSLPMAASAENDHAAQAAAPAAGPVVVVVTPSDSPAPPPEEHRVRPEIVLGGGVRGTLMPSAGLDPFSKHDFFPQGSILAGLGLLRSGPAEIVLFAEWDIGTRMAEARGLDSSLTAHRISGGAETRLYLHRRFFFDAKLAGVAHHLRGSLTDPTLDRPLVSRAWTWGLDVSGGAGVVLVNQRRLRMFLTLDLGYSFAGTASMSYAPKEDPDDPRQYGSVKLPAFKPAGPTSRLGIAFAF
jgi:hypothetical protein